MEQQKIPPDIRLHKRQGQHILVDEEVIKRQVAYAKLTGKETVLEIGPGLGGLTLALAEKAARVIAIEKDARLFNYLRGRVPSNVELVKGDVLKVPFPEFDVVVANLPYHISSPLTFKLLGHDFQKAVLMFQKEFAQRMTAAPGNKVYSRLSVNVYYRADARILEFVPGKAFYPVPDVDSALVELVPRTPPFHVENEVLFFEVVEALFAQRRKKIKNPLASYMKKRTGLDKPALNNIIQKLPFKDERVERLSPEQIGTLADFVHNAVR